VKLYSDPASGNVYKPMLLMAHLGMEYAHIPTTWEDGGTRAPEFLRLNPNGKVPCIEDGDFVLWESGAILNYLARDTPWLPDAPRLKAQVLQWMFFEQYSHEPYIAVARAAMHYDAPGPARDRKIASKGSGGEHALAVMEQHLHACTWFVGDAPTIADIALFAYTHVADEGGFSLAPYPNIRAWIARMQAISGHIPIGPVSD
jgi:glutathione S-transferase